jgi:hypothetical protein
MYKLEILCISEFSPQHVAGERKLGLTPSVLVFSMAPEGIGGHRWPKSVGCGRDQPAMAGIDQFPSRPGESRPGSGQKEEGQGGTELAGSHRGTRRRWLRGQLAAMVAGARGGGGWSRGKGGGERDRT